jgi:hypothetical protein
MQDEEWQDNADRSLHHEEDSAENPVTGRLIHKV